MRLPCPRDLSVRPMRCDRVGPGIHSLARRARLGRIVSWCAIQLFGDRDSAAADDQAEGQEHQEHPQAGVCDARTDPPARRAQAEMVALSMPQREAGGHSPEAECPEEPRRRAEPEQLSGVADTVEGADREIAPLAIRQKPAKNRSAKAPAHRAARAAPQDRRGRTTPKTGPAQATASGCGFTDRSVREMVRGCRTTRATRPPLSAEPRTWPASCTACIPNQQPSRTETISNPWCARFIVGDPASRIAILLVRCRSFTALGRPGMISPSVPAPLRQFHGIGHQSRRVAIESS